MSKVVKNLAASIKDKLLNIARIENRNFNVLLQLYIQERLVYRLSVSNYSDSFILKGGLFLYIISNYKGRPTRDIDFLGHQISNDMDEISNAFKEICKISIEDGIVFDFENLKVEIIRKDAKYEGVRVVVNAYLGKAMQTLQVDIGFGEVIVPKPMYVEKATLLDMGVIKINVYSIESVISEKFEAMITLAELNSRLKDFYDIYELSQTNSFDGRVLQQAIIETFERRLTPLQKEPIIFEDEFYEDLERNEQWKLFLKKIGKEFIAFQRIMDQIKTFIKPIYEAIINEREYFGTWNIEKKQWMKYSEELNHE